MESFQDVPPLWDFSTALSYPPMQDEDFLNMLAKQFPPANHGVMIDPMSFTGVYNNPVVDPQDVNRLPPPLPSLTPPSEDSSPSPANSNHDNEDSEMSAPPKRKASDDDYGEGPSNKSQHTISNNEKKSAGPNGANRRKSTGSAKDEVRLLKRKEQNRAAQRAFRERKEKHVKDLEDRVAELEAQNEEATHENENLRDLLARLQSENMQLKQQAQFTFSMPRNGSSSGDASSAAFGSGLASASSPQSSISRARSPNATNPLDWSSLTTFDPTKLNLLDEVSQQQPTATESAMQLDFGFGNTGLASNAPYTSIASNPMFMSFVSSFDPSASSSTSGDSPNMANLGGGNSSFNNFDMNSLTAWPLSQSNSQDNTLDDLLGYLSPTNNFTNFLTSPSPVAHNNLRPPSRSLSSSSSPSGSSTDPLFSPKDANTPVSECSLGGGSGKCPSNKAELAKCIAASGDSPFAPSVQKTKDDILGTMISCSGSISFPKTQRSDQNVEVLTAWRSITSNPKFKDADISELCAEFTAKARCDGTKVVLEPAGVVSILESLNKRQQ